MFGASDSSFTFGRIAGAPVRIGPGSVLVAAFVAYSLGSQWMDEADTLLVIAVAVFTGLGFMGSILAHEAGHAIVAKRNGIGSREIRLSLFGGVAALERGAPNPGAEMRVAFAGPAVNLVVAVAGLGAAFALARNGNDSILVDAIIWLGGINLILGAFNLLPGLPLDGGRILTGFLWRRRNDRGAAVRTTAKVGKVLAYLAFALAAYELIVAQSPFGLYTGFIGMILLRGADAEVARVSLVDQVQGRTVADIARYQPPVVNELVNTASARALLPTPNPHVPTAQRWAIVTDDDGVVRGLIDLVMLDRVATADGTNPVSDIMVPIDQQRAAFASESLVGVIDRGVVLPFVVIDEAWQPVAIVDSVGVNTPAYCLAMDTIELIQTISSATNQHGAAFYFDPATLAKGKEHGLDGFRFYVLGRGGVLGDVEPAVITSAFAYFHPASIDKIWTSAKEKLAPRVAASLYNECCAELGRSKLASVDGAVLDAYVDAAEAVVAATDVAGLSLFAGWAAEPRADDGPARAMQLIALLRELRGSAHIVALLASGVPAAVAHAIKRPGDVATFGYDSAPEIGPDHPAAYEAAEALTDRLLVPSYGGLSDAQSAALVVGTEAIGAALSS